MGAASDESQVTLTILGAEMAAHAELHHYTDEAGLFGIVTSGIIRATNYRDLNDGTEIVQLREPLRAELAEQLRDLLQRRRGVHARVDRAIRATGGLNRAAAGLADDLVKSLYASSFEAGDVSDLSETAGTAYVASFCTHTAEAYEKENGLLSQWRAYGGRSGFSLVFDTRMLGELLAREYDAAAYTHLNLSDAHHAIDGLQIGDLFPDLIKACVDFAEGLLERRQVTNDGIAQFFPAATLVKHPAFREEREVRMVAIPITERMRALIAKEHSEKFIAASRPEEPGSGKRFIELFKDIDGTLPIKRVIVGPCRNQAEQVEKARSLAAGRFGVVASETPLKT